MEWKLLAVLLPVLFSSPCWGQGLAVDGYGNVLPIWGLSTLIQGGTSPLCNKTFTDANATGFYSINPQVAQGPQAGQPDNYSGKTRAINVAVTIDNPGFTGGDGNTTSASYTLWYDTNGANYSDRYALGYDVCGLVGYGLNYNTQLRGQSDNGSCLSTLDAPCINAIKTTVQQYASWLTTASPGPNSNLSSTSLPAVCRTLSHMLVKNFPTECSYFFGDKLDGIAYALTSHGNQYQTGLTPNCTINGTYQNTLSFYNNASQGIYNAWADSVTPVIAVWMPIADPDAQTTITESVAEMYCGHINHINPGSYVPPTPPAAAAVVYNATTNGTAPNGTASNGTSTSTLTPAPSHSDISGGAIAGIVIGILALFAILAALAFWLWRNKKTQRQQQQSVPAELGSDGTAAKPPMVEASGEDTRFELNGDGTRVQLPATMEEGAKGNRHMLDSKELWELSAKRASKAYEMEA